MASKTTIRGLYHFAYPCRDAEETRHFYEDLLGLPLAHVFSGANFTALQIATSISPTWAG